MTGINVEALGHVVLKVRDIKTMTHFYESKLGFPVSGRARNDSMVFFTIQSRHDFALAATAHVDTNNSSLDHVAFRLAGGVSELKVAEQSLIDAGIDVQPYDHKDVQSLYIHDPEGNQIELYVEMALNASK